MIEVTLGMTDPHCKPGIIIFYPFSRRQVRSLTYDVSGVARNQQKGGPWCSRGATFHERAPLSASERGVNSKATVTSCLCMASYWYLLVVLVLVGVPHNEYETSFAG